MPRPLSALLLAVLSVLAVPLPVPASAETQTPMQYPETRRGDVAETLFGETLADPYRWLENDVRQDKEIADWVARENALTQGYLATLPERAWFAERMRSLLDYERFGLPVKAGRRYFYTRNSGLQNQSQLYVRTGLTGTAKLLLDPNAWAGDAATALDDWKPSKDGRFLLYSVQDGGTDWRILRLLDVRTGKVLPDEIRWAKFTQLAWVGDEGFLYSRFPEPAKGEDFQARNYDQAVYFHRVGTAQAADELVYATPQERAANHAAEVTSDGRHVVITSSVGTDARYEVHVIDLAQRARHGWQPRAIVTGYEHDWKLVEGMGSMLWFVTNQDAPRYRLVSIDLANAKPHWHELVGEREEKLEQGTIIGSSLILSYLKDATSRALVFDLRGKPT